MGAFCLRNVKCIIQEWVFLLSFFSPSFHEFVASLLRLLLLDRRRLLRVHVR